MPHCNHCGFESAPGTRFYPACGQPLPPLTDNMPGTPMPPSAPAPKKKGMSGLTITLIITAAVLLTAAIAFGVYYFMTRDAHKPVVYQAIGEEEVEETVAETDPVVPDHMTGAFISPKGAEWPIAVEIHRRGNLITGATYTNLSQNISFEMDCVQDKNCLSFNGNSGQVFTMFYIYNPDNGRWEGSATEGKSTLPAYLE